MKVGYCACIWRSRPSRRAGRHRRPDWWPGGNIIEVSHQRLFAAASVQAAELEIMVEARDKVHADAIVKSLEENYIVRNV